MQTICVVGLGYVGLPTASIFALSGYQVIGVDTNPHNIDHLAQARTTIAEAGLSTLVEAACRSGRLTPQAAPVPADVFIIAVPTPLGPDRRADFRAVERAAEAIRPVLRPGNLVILESTVPPRTTVDRLRPILERGGLRIGRDLDLVHCPERVLPGQILVELVENARVIGEANPGAGERARRLYASFVHGEIVVTDATTAELVKLMENTYRDVNIALANELAEIAEGLGVDVWSAIGLANRHPRVNVLRPGPGVGGHCIPIDPWFIVEQAGGRASLIPTAREVNDAVPRRIVRRLLDVCAGQPDPVVALLGLAYKANVDDTRGSPARLVGGLLAENGCQVRVHDPIVHPEVALEKVVAGADCLVLLTDHDAYQMLDPSQLGAVMRRRIVFDTRGTIDPSIWRTAGFQVLRLGDGTAGASDE